ncbi:unnamed protein product [Pleuronectes platessa]|uniref:DUF7886 domain-containing protein n=1 Tax=Pleuronectes platessa TaxID=8262 RepID=A0A9N7ZBG3_PLEPL|nr:unnamed protein product [Pleuronectes platessa]
MKMSSSSSSSSALSLICMMSSHGEFFDAGGCEQVFVARIRAWQGDVMKREREQKRKLQHFLGDLALLGSLQGKEELLLTVVNEDLGWRSPGFAVSRASSFSSSSGSSSSSDSPSSSSPSLDSHSSSPLPGEAPAPPGRPTETHTETQPRSVRAPTSEDHLLPASPSEREIAVPEVNCTLFLLAGYVKYGRPYAWIRSNHERLVNIGGTDSMVRDTPMKLKSIADWQTRVIRVWDIVSELVCLCTVPSPSNPFALDMRYIQSLPLPDRFLDELHYDKVVEEVKPLRRLHVQSLLELQRHREASRSSPTVEDSCGEE